MEFASMNAHRRLSCLLFAALQLCWTATAYAVEPADEPVLLVAKPALRDRLYGATILIARPLGNGQHIGFIVNRPTPVKLGTLFPDHGPSQKVVEPVYLGGPVNVEILFALVQRKDNPGDRSLRLTPDLYLVVDRDLVDRVIEAEADHARFYAGVVLWAPGELNAEIARGFWYVDDADAGLVLRKSTDGMWEELVKRLELRARSIRAGLR
jgi:putative transcriptional regulator